jgi:hypothetical protein
MESQRSHSIVSINRLLHTILPFPGSLRQVLASRDRELTPPISQSRKFPPALFSMKIWSDRAIKTALRSVQCPLQHIKISAESAYNFMKRWALQLSDYRRSGTGQKFILICQLSMESQHSNCIESIKRHFYNIPPIPGSLHLVPTCPDAEIPP